MRILEDRLLKLGRPVAAVGALILVLLTASCDQIAAPGETSRLPTGSGEGLLPAAKTAAPANTGLSFPSNGDTWADIRFRWKGSTLMPMYPATYVWRVNERKQNGYYSILMWGPESDFQSDGYYAAQPFPQGSGDKSYSSAHRWSISASSHDFSDDANGHATGLGYGEWKTQALRVYDNGTYKVHDYFWDLPDTTKMIRVLMPRSYGSRKPLLPAITIGDAPWDLRTSRLSGILRGLQFYGNKLSGADLVSEIANPLTTSAGKTNIWYLNINPTPDDITDKSGKGHNPAWVSSYKASLWTEAPAPVPVPVPVPVVKLTASQTIVKYGESASLAWTTQDATACDASGDWKGKQDVQGSVNVGPLTADAAFSLTCTGPGGTSAQTAAIQVLPLPTVTFALTPASALPGETVTLSWSSKQATDCDADGKWKGKKSAQGSETFSAPDTSGDYALTCTGPGGKASASATLTVLVPVPIPDPLPPLPIPELPPLPLPLPDPGSILLPVPPVEEPPVVVPTPDPVPPVVVVPVPEPEPPVVVVPVPVPPVVVVPVPDPLPPVVLPAPPVGPLSGLTFNDNTDPYYDARFRFTGANLQPMYPATIVFRVRPRAQQGYYTTFFWGPEGDYTGNGFYGAHPYPAEEPRDSSRTHNWELSISGHDHVEDANGHNTAVVYDEWKTQAVRVWDNGTNKIHEFYWDLPDTTKVIRVVLDRDYNPLPDRENSLTFGNAQFSPVSEHCACTLRGIQTYAASLSPSDLVSEINSPLSTAAGHQNIWYLNLNPTPEDIGDKSGHGHNPEWYAPYHAGLWISP